MCGCPKRSPERSRKMADGKPAFLGKGFQFYLAVQMLLEQFHNAASLPRCQTAFELRNSFGSLTILRDKVRTNCHGERIDEQLREHLRPIQAWQNQLRQVIDGGVGSSVNAVETLNSGHSGIVGEGVQGCARNMVVDPVDRAWISNTRIRLQVAHCNPAHWPCPRLCVLAIGPKFPFPRIRMVEMNRNNVGLFRWD